MTKMDKPLEIKGSLLARNTLLNLIGQGLPLVVAVVTIPFIIQGLGIERFGLLSLAWVVLGYFAIFDLGLGRATTKFVAEAFYFLSIPVVLVSSSFRGVLEAAQRFDLVNIVRVPSSTLTFNQKTFWDSLLSPFFFLFPLMPVLC